MYTTASYSAGYLEKSGEEITQAVMEASVEGAPRTAGSAQCKWCSALPFCPEARSKIKEIVNEK